MRWARSFAAARPLQMKHGSSAPGGLGLAMYASRQGAQSWSIMFLRRLRLGGRRQGVRPAPPANRQAGKTQHPDLPLAAIWANASWEALAISSGVMSLVCVAMLQRWP